MLWEVYIYHLKIFYPLTSLVHFSVPLKSFGLIASFIDCVRLECDDITTENNNTNIMTCGKKKQWLEHIGFLIKEQSMKKYVIPP